MKKFKLMIIFFFITILLFFIPNFSNATEVSVSRDIYSNNGSMKFNFTGLVLDKTHEYEFGLTKSENVQVATWHAIPETDFTEATVTVDIVTTTKDLREIINVVDIRIYYYKR